MGLATGEPLTAEKVESLQEGRAFDALIETVVMGRRVRMAKGQPVAWDGDNRPVAHGPDDYILEDYNPAQDGPLHPLLTSKAVFPYSTDDRGLVRVADRISNAKGVRSVEIGWVSDAPGWRCRISWTEEGGMERSCESRNAKARLAVYRAALKAVLT